MRSINYCHKNGIIHRDLKADNVVFASKSCSRVKLIDFGISKMCSSDEELNREVTRSEKSRFPKVRTPRRKQLQASVTGSVVAG